MARVPAFRLQIELLKEAAQAKDRGVRAALLEGRRLAARLDETRRVASRKLHELGQQMQVGGRCWLAGWLMVVVPPAIH